MDGMHILPPLFVNVHIAFQNLNIHVAKSFGIISTPGNYNSQDILQDFGKNVSHPTSAV